MVSRDEYSRANARAARRRDAGPTAVAARHDRRGGRVIVSLSTGFDVTFSPRDAQGLEAAKPTQLHPIEISPSCLGLHFPKLDADLYLPALLEGFLGSPRWIAQQMTQRMGEQGGRAPTAAKAAANRRNGKLGGRPRKTAAT
jgi:uncharacterized protein DUF2442